MKTRTLFLGAGAASLLVMPVFADDRDDDEERAVRRDWSEPYPLPDHLV